MSLLVDLLSRTRTGQTRKDIPPDLKKTVSLGARRKRVRRRMIIVSSLAAIVFLVGYATTYMMEGYRETVKAKIATQGSHVHPVAASAGVNTEKTDLISGKTRKDEISSAVRGLPLGSAAGHVSHEVASPSTPVEPVKSRPWKTSQKSGGQETAATTEAWKNQRNPMSSEGRAEKDAYLLAARTHEKKGEYGEALEYYMKVLDLDPGNVMVLSNVSGIFLHLKRFTEAVLYAEKALQIKDSHVAALVNGGIGKVSLGDFSGGETYLGRAVSIDPSNKSAVFNLAALWERMGNHDKAYEGYVRLSQMQDISGFLGAARILEMRGQKSGAARLYRDILNMEAVSPSIRQFAHQQLSRLSK